MELLTLKEECREVRWKELTMSRRFMNSSSRTKCSCWTCSNRLDLKLSAMTTFTSQELIREQFVGNNTVMKAMPIKPRVQCLTQSMIRSTRPLLTKKSVNVLLNLLTCSPEEKFMIWKTLRSPIKLETLPTFTRMLFVRVSSTRCNVTEKELKAWPMPRELTAPYL